MIEAYAFFAVFVIQILAMSGLYPAWFIRYMRRQMASIPAERLPQLYPGVDVARVQKRFLTGYRAMNIGVAVLGLLLLGWLFDYMHRPEWDDGPVEALVSVYFLVQVLPVALIALLAVGFSKVHKPALLEGKRKAVLQRRGLFDFVSPSTVGLAVLGYFLFVGFVIYIQRDPFPGFTGPLSIGGMTLVYVLQAAVVYVMLYGKKPNPFETYAGRVHTIGLVVKSCVYSCMACVVFVSLNFTLVLLDLQRWEPFALSVFFVITALLCSMGMMAAPRLPEDDGRDSEGRASPEARDLPA